MREKVARVLFALAVASCVPVVVLTGPVVLVSALVALGLVLAGADLRERA